MENKYSYEFSPEQSKPNQDDYEEVLSTLRNPAHEECQKNKQYYEQMKLDFLHHSFDEKNRDAQERQQAQKLSPLRLKQWKREISFISERNTPMQSRMK